MPKALFILEDDIRARIYPPAVYDEICQQVDVYGPPQTPAMIRANPAILHEMEYLFSSWSCPRLDADFLNLAPNLKLLFYGAGTVKQIVTDTFWERGLRVTHSADANAITVAQFTVGQIIMSLKGMWQYMREVKQARTFTSRPKFAGLYQATVGLIGLGMIGRHVTELLQPFDLNILAYDPFLSAPEAARLGVTRVDLAALCKKADVVSLHAPWLPETEGMITGALISSMLPHSTFINTARGALVREAELLPALRARPDIMALLDVTYPEPPPRESELYDLANVILTPHIAGAVDANDTRRLGVMMLDELKSYLKDESLLWEVTRDRLKTMA